MHWNDFKNVFYIYASFYSLLNTLTDLFLFHRFWLAYRLERLVENSCYVKTHLAMTSFPADVRKLAPRKQTNLGHELHGKKS